jgi:hypothetical protein
MPHNPIDYSKTIIYKLVCNDLNIKDLYVGYTTDFKSRKNKHKSNCNNQNSKDYNLKVYQFIRANGSWENWSMIEIEKYPCKDIYEATARERYYYELLGGTLNSCVPNRCKKEYNKQYKEEHKEQYKQYREEHKEQLIEYNKQYREENKEQISKQRKQYYQEHIEQYKQYYQDNKNNILQYKKQYREQKKEQIKAQAESKYTCCCCSIVRNDYKSRHEKSKKHLNYVSSIQKQD